MGKSNVMMDLAVIQERTTIQIDVRFCSSNVGRLVIIRGPFASKDLRREHVSVIAIQRFPWSRRCHIVQRICNAK